MSRPCVDLALVSLLAIHGSCGWQLDFDAVSAQSNKPRSPEVDASVSSMPPANNAGHGDTARPNGAAGMPHAGDGDSPNYLTDAGAASMKDSGVSDSAVSDGAVSDGGDTGVPAVMSHAQSLDPAKFSCAAVKPAPAFCDDFESGSLNMWGSTLIEPQTTMSPGSIDIDSHAARAGHGSLLAIVDPAVPTCGPCELAVCLQLPFSELSGHQELHIDFDMRVEEIDSHPGRRSALFQFYFGNPERGYSQHILQVQSTGEQVEAVLVEYDTDGQNPGDTTDPNVLTHEHGLQAGPPLDEWVHVEYVLDAVDSSGSGNSLKLTVGDEVLATGPLFFSLRYQEPMLELGVPFVETVDFSQSDSNGGWQVRFDNVLVRIEAK
jgi:hypothetical protein